MLKSHFLPIFSSSQPNRQQEFGQIFSPIQTNFELVRYTSSLVVAAAARTALCTVIQMLHKITIDSRAAAAAAAAAACHNFT